MYKLTKVREHELRSLATVEFRANPDPFSKSTQAELDENYRMTTFKRIFIWPTLDLDFYAREAEDRLKANAIEGSKLQKERLGLFRDLADEEFANEFGYTLVRKVIGENQS